MAGCPFTYEVRRIVNDAEILLTSHETAALEHSAENGSLRLASSDLALDGEVWTIKLFQKSTYSTSKESEGIYQFDITFSSPNTAPFILNSTSLFEVKAN